eukprot:6068092-Prymnesium_polylepis.1
MGDRIPCTHDTHQSLSPQPSPEPSPQSSPRRQGVGNKRVAETRMNAASSRSHCIFTLVVQQMDPARPDKVQAEGKLTLVDLAGSGAPAHHTDTYTSPTPTPGWLRHAPAKHTARVAHAHRYTLDLDLTYTYISRAEARARIHAHLHLFTHLDSRRGRRADCSVRLASARVACAAAAAGCGSTADVLSALTPFVWRALACGRAAASAARFGQPRGDGGQRADQQIALHLA